MSTDESAAASAPAEKVDTRPGWATLNRASAKQPDYWIVTDYNFFRHATLECANTERDRLAKCFPHKQFGVFHCKRRLEQSTSRIKISMLKEALEAFMECFARAEQFEDERTQRCFRLAHAAMHWFGGAAPAEAEPEPPRSDGDPGLDPLYGERVDSADMGENP